MTPCDQFLHQTNLFIHLSIVTGSEANCIWEKKKEGLKTKRLDGVAMDLGPDFECETEYNDSYDFELFSGQKLNTKSVLETSTEYVENRGAFVG